MNLESDLTRDIPSTLGVKIRGLAEAAMPRELHRAEAQLLAETHLIFNSLVAGVSREILRARDDETSADARSLKALLDVAFQLPANAGNHLLTRLLQAEGKDGSDRNAIVSVRNKAQESFDQAPQATYDSELKKLARRLSALTKDNPDSELATCVSEFRDQPSAESLQKLCDVARNKANWEGISHEVARFKRIATALCDEVQAEATQCIKNCNEALRILDRRKSEGHLPWGQFTVEIPGPAGSATACRLSQLPEAWQRQIFQAALESLKSHFNLKRFVAEERTKWQEARNKLEEVPEVKAYLLLRERFLNEISRYGQRKGLRDLSAAQLLDILERIGPSLHGWRTAEERPLTVSPEMRAQAAAIESLPESARGRRTGAFRRDLSNLHPELGAFFDLHERYQRSFARMPGEPTLTIPDPYKHPKHLIWSRAQWQTLILPGEEGADAKGWLKIRLPLLRCSKNGVESYSELFTVQGDERLHGITRRISRETNTKGKVVPRERFYQPDPISGRVQEVRFGAVRLVIDAAKHEPSNLADLATGDFKLKILLNRVVAEAPSWIQQYLDRKNPDPRTNEPRLPDRCIVASFVNDLGGDAVMKAAVVSPQVYDGKRPLKYLNHGALVVNNLPPPEKIERLRFLAGALIKRRLALMAELDELDRDDRSLRPARRALVTRIVRARTRERKLWNHIERLGDDRANRFAGAVVRKLETLRKEHPNHEIAIALDYRADRKPDNFKWSRDFNRLLASTSTGQLLDKVAEACGRLDPPVAVLHVPTFGFDKQGPNASQPNVLSFRISRGKANKHTVTPAPFSKECAVVSRDSKGKVKVSFQTRNELIADNLIQRLVTPSRYRKQPSALQTKKQLEGLWRDAEQEIRRLKNLK